MKRRFFISKSLLIVASFFWASCGEDDSQPISINVYHGIQFIPRTQQLRKFLTAIEQPK